jgi:uncharacterized damage-inducible protein DinB
MSQTAVATPNTAAESLLTLSGLVEGSFKLVVADITHEESLRQPPAGNCINWNVGHLVHVHNGVLKLLGKEPVGDNEVLKRYGRGSAPLTDPNEAMRLEELIELWNTAVARANEGLRQITPEQLAPKLSGSPRGNPDETVGSMLTVLFFHQTYHLGCLSALRRLVGKPGAIK